MRDADKTKLFLAEYLIRSDLHIMETLRKFFSKRKEYFTV